MNPKMKQTLQSIYGCVDRLGFDPLTGAANPALAVVVAVGHRACKLGGASAPSDGRAVLT